jgi:hypothetical protein
MKKALLALGLLGAVALARPAPADAQFSLSIGLPGFGLFVAPPFVAPPVAYAPAPVYYPPPAFYPPPVAFYYRSAPVFVHGGYAYGRRVGWYRHGRRW